MKNRIANRLKEFTKKINASLERLASKFDLSRLAVTKWDRRGNCRASNIQICLTNLNLFEHGTDDYAQYVK